jgi:hypothetical protein
MQISKEPKVHETGHLVNRLQVSSFVKLKLRKNIKYSMIRKGKKVLPFVLQNRGKQLSGNCCHLTQYPAGLMLTNSCWTNTVRSYSRPKNASNQYSEFTQKRETSGHIYLVSDVITGSFIDSYLSIVVSTVTRNSCFRGDYNLLFHAIRMVFSHQGKSRFQHVFDFINLLPRLFNFVSHIRLSFQKLESTASKVFYSHLMSAE